MAASDRRGREGIALPEKAKGAFLGAAIGDALGWPQEDLSRRVDARSGPRPSEVVQSLQSWVRRSGGRFYPHEEVILAGEYSDDTQLLLCTARSLLTGLRWWHHLTARELPSWTLYKRGGGAATNWAAHTWVAGRMPWSREIKPADRRRYFEAGGNGVAMRIMPHSLVGVDSPEFAPIARNIFANGVCTHGHPRALVGALAYGFAVWGALKQTGTLEYGRIIEITLSSVDLWSRLPELDDICRTWRDAADDISGGRYEEIWRKTVTEMVRLLERSREAMKQGALSVDHEVLANLGCFERQIKGAGTVAAAASVFLASRYAADPAHGLIEAAFAHGADTDTIASMTGCLLGAVHGTEWFGDYARQVQDAQYLQTVAQRLASGDKMSRGSDVPEFSAVTNSELDTTILRLEECKPGDSVRLPDGREARVSAPQMHPTRSETILAFSWKLTTIDGQTLYVKKISRRKAERRSEVRTPFDERRRAQTERTRSIEVIKTGVKLPVHDMVVARAFYSEVLGLKIAKESRAFVNFGGVIALVPADYEKELADSIATGASEVRRGAIIYIEVKSLDLIYENVQRCGAAILSSLTHAPGQRFFRCYDPDGNVVELFEIKRGL